MKWFQHQTDASDDIKIKRLEKRFNLQGYAIFFKIIEKVGKEGDNFSLSIKKFPIDDLALSFGAEKKLISDCLTFMNEIGLIVFKKGEISIPNMKKYASNWTKRISVGATEVLQSNDRVPTAKEKNKREEIRIKENKTKESVCLILKDWNDCQSSPLPAFKPENIVNKHGAEKIDELVKIYGRKNGGFKLFLGALKTL